MPPSYATVTPLGKHMARRGYTKAEIVALTGIPDRTLTEVLAGRMPIPPGALPKLCKALHLYPEDLV